MLFLGMQNLSLPRLQSGKNIPVLPSAGQLTIIGASGAGKSRFMDELIRLAGHKAYCLSAISAPYPEREETDRRGSIDMQFREAIANKPYMRSDAVSQIDKLVYMLFADEIDRLLTLKERENGDKREKVKLPATRLDRLKKLWEKIFPGNSIKRTGGSLLFSTAAGGDLIMADKLSQGEQTVFYYAAAVLFALPESVIFIDSPSLFLHPTLLNNVWNSIESLRPDCRFVYNSVDVGFVGSRTKNVSIWVKSYDADNNSWDYEVIRPGELHEEIFIDLIGSRHPILFIEGDAAHSIDGRLYPLVFPEYTVRPLGSCNRVIETTRTFKDQTNLHHLDSRGIVDRDRRTKPEVDYLRKKGIMVPDVAEVENIFLLEGVIKAMARRRGRNPSAVMSKVKKKVISEFAAKYKEQALQHVRHRVKREVEYKIDMRFSCITAMETHLKTMFIKLDPRGQYYRLLEEFSGMIGRKDYASILKVFNHKPLLGICGVAGELGYKSKEDYISGVISALKENSPESDSLREAIRYCLTGNRTDTEKSKIENQQNNPK